MGSCLSGDGRAEGDHVSPRSSRRRHAGPAEGKNQKLKHSLIVWKSEEPMTTGQLTSKRDEFWDTAPAFEGRKEIWDALKAAASACEQFQYGLAQAILDGANITLPHGLLTECYDELGNRYLLPPYVLSTPANFITSKTEEPLAADSNDDPGEDVMLKLRLSSGRDLKLTVKSGTRVGNVKQTLARHEDLNPNQRWFYGGKVLQDKTRIHEIGVPKGYVIQVVLPYEPPSTTETNDELTDPTPVDS